MAALCCIAMKLALARLGNPTLRNPRRAVFCAYVRFQLTFGVTLCRLTTMGVNQPRATTQTLKLLSTFTSRSDEISGAEIARSTGLASGTLYPILLRLEVAGWLESRWEEEDPRKLERPRRRLYRITGLGVRQARAAFRDISCGLKEFAWR
jgi:PadR family transcriptional regulator, regulatory protein PadR